MRLAEDWQSSNAKREVWRDLGERSIGALSSRQTVGNDADMVTTLDLSMGEIENMTKDSADRSPYGVQDAKRPV